MEQATHGLRHRGARWLAASGVLLVVLGSFGWWLSTRVLDSDGFGDVVAIASQKAPVRDYVAQQASLRLARSSNFVSAARPVVADAIAVAIENDAVKNAVHDVVARAHDQIFQATKARRVDVDSQQAAVSVRNALYAINPSLARKLPNDVLDTTSRVSQSSTVDLLFRTSRWVEDLWLPVLLAGIGLLVVVVVKARDRVHAIRVVGVALAVGGALLLGVGFATPAFSTVAATNDPGRGEAVAAFIEVLVGRLVGAGQAMVVVGLLLALAPGHDGGDLGDRVTRLRAWIQAKRARPRWRFAGGVVLIVLAWLAVTKPSVLLHDALVVLAVGVLYVGIVVCLRASHLLVTDHSIARLHKRQVVGVFVAMVVATLLTATLAVGLVASGTQTARANPSNEGCNGYIELCPFPINEIMWPGSHNAMSSSAYDFFGAEHTLTIPEQLNAGARFFMIDAYYGYDDDGLVRTNLAGGVTRQQLEADSGPDAVRELDRIGALTGVADTSGKKQDVYLCHDFCELGAVKASDVFAGVDDFLSRNLTDVVVLDVEDYVRPQDLRQALVDGGLWDRVWIPPKHMTEWPSLHDMVVPKNPKATEKPRRVILMSEKHPDVYRWLLGTYSVSEETPFTFTSTNQFNCAVNRGGTGKPFFIVNHWLRPNGPPDPVGANTVNSQKLLTARLQQCIAERGRIPDVLAVDFTGIGDLYKTVNQFNAAIARKKRASRDTACHPPR